MSDISVKKREPVIESVTITLSETEARELLAYLCAPSDDRVHEARNRAYCIYSIAENLKAALV